MVLGGNDLQIAFAQASKTIIQYYSGSKATHGNSGQKESYWRFEIDALCTLSSLKANYNRIPPRSCCVFWRTAAGVAHWNACWPAKRWFVAWLKSPALPVGDRAMAGSDWTYRTHGMSWQPLFLGKSLATVVSTMPFLVPLMPLEWRSFFFSCKKRQRSINPGWLMRDTGIPQESDFISY